MVHWRHNVFSVSKSWKDICWRAIQALPCLWHSFSNEKTVALKAATVLPILLLQKPSKRSKVREHSHSLQRQLTSWTNGDLKELLKEGWAQRHYHWQRMASHCTRPPFMMHLLLNSARFCFCSGLLQQ